MIILNFYNNDPRLAMDKVKQGNLTDRQRTIIDNVQTFYS